ncbi:MAG: hypothetical protein NT045_07305 [Candidatus Aureabacteria bacterium]|nr:hypothetical protein [Candidatus Auribacterota bacterium]
MLSVKLRISITVASTAAALSLLVWKRALFPAPVARALAALRDGWLRVARVIGHAQTVAILFVCYFTGIALAALFSRCMRHDHLRLNEPGRWHPRNRKPDTIETLMRQF